MHSCLGLLQTQRAIRLSHVSFGDRHLANSHHYLGYPCQNASALVFLCEAHLLQTEACYQRTVIWLWYESSYLFHFAAFSIGTESKMKLWDVLATCFLLLSSVATRPLYQNSPPAKRTPFPSSYRDSVDEEESSFQREDHNLQEISMEDQCKARRMNFVQVNMDD